MKSSYLGGAWENIREQLDGIASMLGSYKGHY
jgi:hypothetical protein